MPLDIFLALAILCGVGLLNLAWVTFDQLRAQKRWRAHDANMAQWRRQVR